VLRSGRRRLVEYSVACSNRWIRKSVNWLLRDLVTRTAWQSCNAMEEYLLARNRKGYPLRTRNIWAYLERLEAETSVEEVPSSLVSLRFAVGRMADDSLI
jgi:hypothetical protein